MQNMTDVQASVPVLDMETKSASPHKKLKIILVIVGAIIVLAGITAFVFYQYTKNTEKELDVDVFYEGILIENIDVSGMTKTEAKEMLEDILPELREEISLNVTFGDKVYSYTQDDFEFEFDLDDVIDQAYQTAREGNLWERYGKYRELQTSPMNFSITSELTNADEVLSDIADEIVAENTKAAKNASIAAFNPGAGTTIDEMFTFQEGETGIAIDRDAIMEDLQKIMDSDTKTGTFEAKWSEVEYETDIAALKASFGHLGTGYTVSTNTDDGNHNMANALGKLNGLVVESGETVSFNETVGQRTVANGFKEALVIDNGNLVDGLGGGVCQASTTLYHAAVLSGLEIVERGNHSYPSSYVKIGQDAMVNWGSQDFKFKNNTDSPVYLKAYMSGAKLYVHVYGELSDEWDEIKMVSQQTGTTAPPSPTYEDDPTLEEGKEVVKSAAKSGYTATAQRIYYKDGKQVKTEDLPSSTYRSAAAVILRGTKNVKETAATAEE